ncbi:hypothetical protein HYV57_06090 [Candidatus Peregrinibacteria bacterium]|nr:hypothetical protein [Candidatus Peregrinibacteria bacterium]
MNFKELKIIINFLRKKIQCPNCANCYFEKDISVLNTTRNEGVIFMECSKCGGNILLSVGLDQKVKTKKIMMKNSDQLISSNDVLDMHNFLKSFNGDLEEYIIKKLS